MKTKLSILFLLCALAFGLVACSTTVIPDPVVATQASWDGDQQNSGIVSVCDGYVIVTPRARERYNALIVSYGKEFTPALVEDYGVTALDDGTFRVTAEAVQKWAVMNNWRKQGKASLK